MYRMPLKNYLYVLMLLQLFVSSRVQAQTIYGVSNEKKIYRINEDYTSTYLSTAGPTPFLIGDIAISPAGVMYGVAQNSIYQINPQTGQTTFIVELPPCCYVSLVCSNDFELYMINSSQKSLYKYNLLTNTITNVAYLGFYTSGDLTFYKGNLIFQTWSDDGSVYIVKAYNLASGNLVDILCHPGYLQLWGLTTKYNSCDSGTILAINPNNELLDMNFEDQTFTELPFVFPSTEVLYGLASTNEYLGSLCTSQELENLACMLSIDDFKKNKVTLYPVPTDDQLYLGNIDAVSNIWIYDMTGKMVKKQSGQSIKEIAVSDLVKGIYLLKIENDEGTFIKKFVKK